MPAAPDTPHFSVIVRDDTVHLRTPDERVHWAFDPEGRLLSGHLDRDHLQIGLDGTALLRRRLPDGTRLPPRALGEGDAAMWMDVVASHARAAWDQHDEASRPIALERAASRGAQRWRADRAAFQTVYTPVPILPPDNYRALLVQLTEGCSWNQCTFCNLYTDRPFRVKTAAALAAHLDAIRAFLGESERLRLRVFLGDANACLVPQRRLLAAMEQIRGHFPRPAAAGFHSFLDTFSPPGKSSAEWTALAGAGLRRVNIGLETGHAPLLKTLNKPGSPDRAVSVVQQLTAAGIQVGVIVLVGAGGAELADVHVADTVATIRQMGLSKGDVVYLSPLVTEPPADPALLTRQEATLREALADGDHQVALYDLRRWVY